MLRQAVGHYGHVDDAQTIPIGWIREIVLNTCDPWELAHFWAGLLGGEPTEWYPGWVTLEPPPRGQRLSFQRTATDSDADSQTGAKVHFDVFVNDLASAHERVVAAGAVFVAEHISPRPGPGTDQGSTEEVRTEEVRWRVYLDPADHLFCLVVRLASNSLRVPFASLPIR